MNQPLQHGSPYLHTEWIRFHDSSKSHHFIKYLSVRPSVWTGTGGSNRPVNDVNVNFDPDAKLVCTSMQTTWRGGPEPLVSVSSHRFLQAYRHHSFSELFQSAQFRYQLPQKGWPAPTSIYDRPIARDTDYLPVNTGRSSREVDEQGQFSFPDGHGGDCIRGRLRDSEGWKGRIVQAT